MPRSAITRVSSLAITPSSTNKNNGFYAPQLTTAQRDAIPASTLTNGAIIYNTTATTYQVYQTYVNAAANVTTSAWTTLSSIPVMTAAQGAFFEAVNLVAGQMYVRSDTNLVRIYKGDAWVTITTA
jgi:hypothetical protein